MSAYPMFVLSMSGEHKGGTKEYHIINITAPSGAALLVRRWGKKGAFGQVKIELHDSGAKEANRLIDNRRSNGYDMRHNSAQNNIADLDELKRVLGRGVMAKITQTHLLHLDPTMDVTGYKQTAAVDAYADGGGLNRDPELARIAARELEEKTRIAKEAQEKSEIEALQALPNFGMFS